MRHPLLLCSAILLTTSALGLPPASKKPSSPKPETALAASLPDPVATAQEFYEKHYDFYYDDPTELKSLLSKRFYEVLVKEQKILNSGDQGAIGAVPWLSAQDGEISGTPKFSLLNRTDNSASVKMTYLFLLGEKKRSQSVTLNFERRAESWVLSDFFPPNEGSLLKSLEKWHKEFGE